MLPDKIRVIKRKIGELLLERGLVTRDVLEEALSFQKAYGVSLGTYLVRHGYVTEKDIVQCLSSQYGFPSINLLNFRIETDVLNQIPVSIAVKYCLIPLDRLYGLITIAMADPLNEEAIESVKSISGCDVQIFIATVSDINAALESYYRVNIYGQIQTDVNQKNINVEGYRGKERRKFFRFKTDIDVHFGFRDKYLKGQTKDISGGGVCFLSQDSFPSNKYLAFEINLPSQVLDRPIASVVKIVRAKEIKDKKIYEIGAIFVQLDPLDRAAIIKYAKSAIK